MNQQIIDSPPQSNVGTPPAQPNTGTFGKMSGFIAAHSGAALAMIVILVILVLALYAMRRGWFGLGGRNKASARDRARKKTAGSSTVEASDEKVDTEIEHLIDSITGRACYRANNCPVFTRQSI